MIPLILTTFVVVFIAELPDKTALAALCLATHLRTRDVIAGAWLAFLVQTAVAVFAGGLLQLLPSAPVRIAAGIGFLVFAVLALRRNAAVDEAAEAEQCAVVERRHRHAWVTSFLVIFAAEWGDLTQLATAALVAQTGHILEVAIGAVAALWTVTVLAAFAGSQLGRLFTPVWLNRISAGLFTIVGLVVIGSAVLRV